MTVTVHARGSTDPATALSTRLVLHHVGGRAGSTPFPMVPRFASDIVMCLYEADPSCVQQIARRSAKSGMTVHTLPYLLWNEDGQDLTLNVTYDPYNSSVYELNPTYKTWHYAYPVTLPGRPYRFPPYDYTFDPGVVTMEKMVVRSHTLDTVCARAAEEGGPPPPDVLGLDVQGAEFEVLSGGRGVLERNVLCVATEIEFHEVYKGQKLFDDVFRMLRASSFHFVDVTLFDHSPYRAPIALRGSGFGIAGDALFLRDLDALPGVPGTAPWIVQARKLAFIALMFGRVEYAIMILRRIDAMGAGTIHAGERQYLRCLADFYEAVRNDPTPLRPTFADVYPFEASKGRFSTVVPSAAASARPGIRRWLQRRPSLLWAARTLVEPMRKGRRGARSAYASAQWWTTRKWRPAKAERVLRQYGLRTVADKLTAHRKAAFLAAAR